MGRVIFILVFLCMLSSSTNAYFYLRVCFKDKSGGKYSVEKPNEFLSERAIERRLRQGIAITDEDLPVSDRYLSEVLKIDGKAVCSSKWLNTVVIEVNDTIAKQRLIMLPFISDVDVIGELPYKAEESKGEGDYFDVVKDEIPDSIYGYSGFQIRMHHGNRLHEEGFRGEGMLISVIDAGFGDIESNKYFDMNRVAKRVDLRLYKGDSLMIEKHGGEILSVMLADKRGDFIGTAPMADYFLLSTEDFYSEQPFEEDLWVRGVEFADSIGTDVIVSSLGYTVFGDKEVRYSPDCLDGKTAFSSRGASAAARKGMIVVTSAGNEGCKSWKKISFPGDADGVLTVGGVDRDMDISWFSPMGYTTDGRVKPDVSSLAVSSAIVTETGVVRAVNGTSFAAPVIGGLAACLWQALRHLTARQVTDLIRYNSDRPLLPDNKYGYGIPDFYGAYKEGIGQNRVKPLN